MAQYIREPHHQIMSLNGDGSGQQNINGDYSVTPATFFITPPAGKDFVITHIHFIIASAAAMNVADYGGIAGGITNGMIWQTVIDGVTMDRFSGLRLKQNGDYEIISEVTLSTYAGLGQVLKCEFSFPDNYTESFRLTPGNSFQIIAQDNLTALTKHYCACYGRLEYYV